MKYTRILSAAVAKTKVTVTVVVKGTLRSLLRDRKIPRR